MYNPTQPLVSLHDFAVKVATADSGWMAAAILQVVENLLGKEAAEQVLLLSLEIS